ncbi:hypothetical protein [Aminobacter sp. MET-1]|uniref:hypothetical protein n=1 Tax=Aminobacter sp. MET-1 TaxID=2951085 RepID=UPI00226AC18D|nr:hypothetical protein [Aminobacter sp. MET-1]MCX8568435.1 hypothetical protein [Aminobacter sp. MET-1]
MSEVTLVRELTFHVAAAPHIDGYEVRIIADGRDLIGDGAELMGLDPLELYDQSELLEGGRVLIARCSCGESGCDNLPIEVRIGPRSAEWVGDGLHLSFALDRYRSAIATAANDHSWEDGNRLATRLVHDYLAGTSLSDGKSLRWVGSRGSPGQLQLSFEDKTSQTLVALTWDGSDPQTAIRAARQFLENLALWRS